MGHSRNFSFDVHAKLFASVNQVAVRCALNLVSNENIGVSSVCMCFSVRQNIFSARLMLCSPSHKHDKFLKHGLFVAGIDGVIIGDSDLLQFDGVGDHDYSLQRRAESD